MLCVKYPTKISIRNANVDSQKNEDRPKEGGGAEEEMYMLSSYAKDMVSRCGAQAKAAKQKRAQVIEAIGAGLSLAENKEDISTPTSKDETINHVVYDLCGYLLCTRKNLLKCPNCLRTLARDPESLPENHEASTWTTMKNRGGLKFCTDAMFQTFRAVEEVLRQHFTSNQVYMRDSFELVISKLVEEKLKIPQICCDDHREHTVPSLIYEYIMIRFQFQAKSERNNIASKRKAQSLKKQSRLVTSKKNKRK